MTGRRNELSEEYLSQVAHEFRGSLNAILGWAEFLRTDTCDDAARLRAAETIIRHARLQTAMLGELLDTWRQAAGTLKFAVHAFDFGVVLKDAVASVQPLANARRVRIDLQGDAAGARMRGDARRLTQSLSALLTNAVHFAPDGTTVTVVLEVGSGGCRLTIHDSGLGVPLAALPWLFDRDRPPGTGHASSRSGFRLGLSLVRDVITWHGGAIDATSGGEDAGMTFRVMLPVESRAGAIVEPRERPAEPATTFSPPKLDGMRILLVEDEPDAREALTSILRQYGGIVQTAGSAAEAIGALQQWPFHVLLADIGMPGADGYDLIRYIRGLGSTPVARMPAVAVTAFASDADRRRAMDAGFQVHLAKPVDPSALVATVAVVGRPPQAS